ncbi:MAG: PBSX family phage terminase large subunit [Psychroflexus sp.]|nr:PBSX family phage terminase large subunit [Psychroflexus sp.]
MKILKKYQPLFHKNNKQRYYLITGGRGSAKSFHVSLFLVNLTYNTGHVILFTRWTMTSAHISIMPEFLEKIEMLNAEKDFKISQKEIINIRTGSRIIFRGIKTSQGTATANLKSIQGVTTWVLDEAEELVDENIFDKIDFSIRHPELTNRVVLILNPTTKEHFIYKRFFEQKGIEAESNKKTKDSVYIHTSYLNNKRNLSESFLQRAEDMKKNNPKKHKHVMLGGWLDKAEGVVFENWEYGKFNPDNLQTSFGLDFGFSIDPDALNEIAIDKSKKIIYVKNHIYKNGLKLDDLAKLILTATQKKLVVADSAEPRLIADLKAKGINIVPIKKGTIESGITIMLDYKIIVDPSSTSIGKEFNNYTYLDKGSKMYIDDWNHNIDGIRYNVTYQLDNPHKGKYFVY